MSNIILPTDYIINIFYQYAGYPRKKSSGVYYGGCSTCREGHSWQKKRRLYYLVSENIIYCHNCGLSKSPLNWIIEVSGKTYLEILKESGTYSSSLDYYNAKEQINNISEKVIDIELPKDSINLFDPIQIEYYKDNRVVKDALDLIKRRRLDTLINQPKSFYLSLNDQIHCNRLIIPFYDIENKITFYQSRAIYNKDSENGKKYLSKLNASKGIYGLNNIDLKLETIFITEGPIDSMSLHNGICVAGIHITDYQKKALEPFFLFKKVWCLDNPYIDKTAREKTQEIIEEGETVFIWPKEHKQKDFNDICCDLKIDQISPKFILKNSFSGEIALLKIKMII
jgi:hypothetical protein